MRPNCALKIPTKLRKLLIFWLRGLDLNQRPLGYEPNELPGCSTPHLQSTNTRYVGQITDCAGHLCNPVHC
jgi:hypothetical protein